MSDDLTEEGASEPRLATWEEAAAVVRQRYPLIPEEAITEWVRIFGSLPAGQLEPDAWELAHSAYGWARRDPEWGIRIVALERERRETEDYVAALLAEEREAERAATEEEELDDVERLRALAMDLLQGIDDALFTRRPPHQVADLVSQALEVLRTWG